MARSKKGCNQNRGRSLPYFWQTNALNQAAYFMFLDQLESIAMNRFKWIGLPETCDARYLEWTLMYQGVASIAKPKNTDMFFSTMASTEGTLNVYDNPTSWRAYGNQGFDFTGTPFNGVLVWDNRIRRPILPMLEFYAYELADIKRTKMINRLQQKTPYIITAPQTQKNDMVQMFKQISGGEPAILGTPNVQDIKVDALQTGVPFLGEELNTDLLNVWNEAMTALGIRNLAKKTERMIDDEVNANNEPTTIRLMDPLGSRREAADKLNKRFGTNIQVVKNYDSESENVEFLSNIRKQVDAFDGNRGDGQ